MNNNDLQACIQSFTEDDFKIHLHAFTEKQEVAIVLLVKELLAKQVIKKHSDIETVVAIACCVLDSKYFDASTHHHFLKKLESIAQAINEHGDFLIEQWLEEADDLSQEALSVNFSKRLGL